MASRKQPKLTSSFGLAVWDLFTKELEPRIASIDGIQGIMLRCVFDQFEDRIIETIEYLDQDEGLQKQFMARIRSALDEMAPGAPAERTQRALHHLGLELAPEEFEGERERLEGLGFDVRLGEHPFLPVRGMYIDDPDGNEVELIASTQEDG